METNFTPEGPTTRTAVLIDATTFPVEAADVLFSIVASYGEIAIKRAFGNWSNPDSRPWAERLASHAIVPTQRFDYPDDRAPDVDIAIEAMDLLERGKINSFALATGSGALGRLAIRLRESGAAVLGFACPPATNGPFRTACSYFWTVDDMRALREAEQTGGEEDTIPPVWDTAKETSSSTATAAAAPEEAADRFKDLLKQAVAENEGDDGWALLSSVGSSIKALCPSFNPTDFGFKNLKNLVENSRDIVRVNTVTPCKVRLLDDFS